MSHHIIGEFNTADIKLDEEFIEEECLEQIRSMADSEAFEGDGDIAIMPDTHWGSGAVIGFTMPLKNKVCPNTIGVDIGCGMYAANLGKHEDLDLEELDEEIREKIPMGFNVHDRTDYHFKDDFPWERCKEKAEEFNENSDMPDIDTDYSIDYFKELLKKIGYKTGRTINSMGTLGGGNHFIEIGESQEHGDTWCVIHSGSRGIGARIAEYWQDEAVESRKRKMLLEKCNTIKMPNGDSVYPYVKFNKADGGITRMAWLQGAKGESFKKEDEIREVFDGEEIQEAHNKLIELMPDKYELNEDHAHLCGNDAREYIKDMIFAQTYASESRSQMMRKVTEAFQEVNDEVPLYTDLIESVHNYIDFEDQTIRKGACRAHEDEKIVIPFNMSYGTLIAKGKGKESWNRSAPHGAGRAMSRTAAKEKYSEEDMKEQTEGVYMSKNPVDETPKAYKDPEMVERAIGETAEIIDRIKPIMSLKAE